jgi:hypothetical protein
MSDRRARFVFEPLTDWPYPEEKRIQSQFTAKWRDTRDLLLAEADHLGARLVVCELDLTRDDLRLDGEIRANARLSSGRVRVSMDTRHGAMRYAVDRYLPGWGQSNGPSWQHNIRAIALTLQALRAVDRYGAVHSAEQYQGFRALPAGGSDPAPFGSADEALRWVRAQADAGEDLPPATAMKRAVRLMHPDTGADPAQWARLDEARRLMEKAGLL